MDFYTVLDDVIALLRSRRRVPYGALKRQFSLDDAYLDDLKVELIEVHQMAVDQDGTILVWTGATDTVPGAVPGATESMPQAEPLCRRDGCQRHTSTPISLWLDIRAKVGLNTCDWAA